MKRVRLKIIVNLNLIFIYTTTINKQVLHLILISPCHRCQCQSVINMGRRRSTLENPRIKGGSNFGRSGEKRVHCTLRYLDTNNCNSSYVKGNQLCPPPPRGLVTIFYRMESTPSTLTLLIRTRQLLKQQYVKDEYRITQC